MDSIEHGTGLTEELLDEVVRRGLAVVPTLINIDNFPSIAASGEAKFPIYAAHMRALHATSRQRIRLAWEAGIPIYTGTDAGGSMYHGLLREEIRELVGAGIPAAPRSLPRRPGGRGSGSACPDWSRGRPATWSSSTPTRDRISRRWPSRSGSCCGVRSLR